MAAALAAPEATGKTLELRRNEAPEGKGTRAMAGRDYTRMFTKLTLGGWAGGRAGAWGRGLLGIGGGGLGQALGVGGGGWQRVGNSVVCVWGGGGPPASSMAGSVGRAGHNRLTLPAPLPPPPATPPPRLLRRPPPQTATGGAWACCPSPRPCRLPRPSRRSA